MSCSLLVTLTLNNVFKMVLLRYNLHTIQSTHFKHTIQYTISTFTELYNYGHNLILEHFHHLKMKL